MSVSATGHDISAAWTFHKKPTSPPEPPDFSQFAPSNAGTALAASASPGAAGTVDSGRAKIGSDLNSLLLDLQSATGTSSTNGSATASPTASTSATGSSALGTSAPGTGNIVSDLQSFFNDLQGAGQDAGATQGAGGAHRHHHGGHHGPAPFSGGPQDLPDPTGTISSATETSTATGNATPGSSSASANGLLGYITKALQNYSSSDASSLAQSSSSALAVSA